MSFLQYLEEDLTASQFLDMDEPEEELGSKLKGRREKRKEPKIMFARWGAMNPKRDKAKEKEFRGMSRAKDPEQIGFHTPPENKGIFAFIWPYIEPFLVGWNKKIMIKTGRKDKYGDEREKFPHIKKFQHHGFIWTHFIEAARDTNVGKEYKGDWVKVHTNDLPMLLRKTFSKDTKELKKDPWSQDDVPHVSNPYKRGGTLGMRMTRDHLEVFIPGKVKES